MNAYAYFIVNHNLDYRLDRPARWQHFEAPNPRPSLRARIASAVAGARRVFDPVDLSGPVVPRLENYPYRG